MIIVRDEGEDPEERFIIHERTPLDFAAEKTYNIER